MGGPLLSATVAAELECQGDDNASHADDHRAGDDDHEHLKTADAVRGYLDQTHEIAIALSAYGLVGILAKRI